MPFALTSSEALALDWKLTGRCSPLPDAPSEKIFYMGTGWDVQRSSASGRRRWEMTTRNTGWEAGGAPWEAEGSGRIKGAAEDAQRLQPPDCDCVGGGGSERSGGEGGG